MTGAQLLADVRAKHGRVADLARALSLAPSADVRLVRSIRLGCFPRSGVSLEADLWASALVQSRSGPMLVLRADVQAALWTELRANRPELDRCYATLRAARTADRPLLTLEDELTHCALAGDGDGIERILGMVAKTMLDEPARRSDLAAWSARVIARLQEHLRESEAAKLLASVAAGWVITPTSVAAMTPAPETARLAAQLHPDAPRTRISIRRVGDTLEVGNVKDPSAVALEIPAASPVIIVDEDRTYRIDPHNVTRIEVRSPEVMLGASDGKRWLLGPKQETPNVAAIASASGRGGQIAVYLVAPTLAVTSAQAMLDEDMPIVNFGGRALQARVVGMDRDADIAILRLSDAAPVAPLELDDDVHAGQTCRIYGLPRGSAFVTNELPGSAQRRWQGTVAAVSPSLTLRVPFDEVPEALNRPGMPVFVGRKVIGHLEGDQRRPNALRAASVRTIKQWIARAQTVRPLQPMSLVVRARTQAMADEAKVALGSLIIPNWQVWVEYAAAGVVTEDDLQLAVSARSTGARSMVIALATSQAVEVQAAADAQTITVRHVESIAEAEDAVRRDLGVSQTNSRPALPRVWLTSRDAEGAPQETAFIGSPNAQPNDLVVLFGTIRGRRQPTGLYRVTDGRRFASGGAETQPTSSELTGSLLLAFVPTSDRDVETELASLASTTSTRDARNLNIYDRLTELLLACTAPEAAEELLSHLGVPASLSAARRLQIAIELPERVPLAGLLGIVIEQRGEQSLLRRYGWYQHGVRIALAPEAELRRPSQAASVRFRVTSTSDVLIEVSAAVGGQPFERALVRTLNARGTATPPSNTAGDAILSSFGMRPAAVLRRAIAHVISSLALLDAASQNVRELFIRFPGIAAFDLVELQDRVVLRDPTAPFRLVSFDPETDVAQLVVLGEFSNVHRISDVLDLKAAEVFVAQRDGDDIAHEFGTSPTRRHRRMLISVSYDAADVEIRAETGRLVRGYVSFHWTDERNRIQTRRVRATNGVASLSLARRDRGYAVGALVEDENLMLEGYVAGKDNPS